MPETNPPAPQRDTTWLLNSILIALLAILATYFGYQLVPPSPPTPTPSPSASVSATPSPTPSPTAASALSAVWANDGGDKVPREDRRAAVNPAWDGTKVVLSGARNEVVGFALILEAGTSAASGVSVALPRLATTGGQAITTGPTANVFNWVGRNIELFVVDYLQIKGLSLLSYNPSYDERHVPARFRRPFDPATGIASGTWAQRPDAGKSYPEIAVPHELRPAFNVVANQSQTVWVDVYVPKAQTPGLYTGAVEIREAGALTRTVPVQLTVRSFTLPDVATAKTMLFTGYADVSRRYIGATEPAAGTAAATRLQLIRDRHWLVAHRHKIAMIDANAGAGSWTTDAPRPEWGPRLSGALFTAVNGYDGPGVGTGNGVFSIGTYGSWRDNPGTAATMATHTNAWESWFQANSPSTERFLYLVDEPSTAAQDTQINTWLSWMKANTGVGRALPGFVTVDLQHAISRLPTLDISATWMAVGPTSWQTAYTQHKAAGHKVYAYNGKRPATGSFAIEDDGVALRELVWAQMKKGIDRWYFWEATYYNDYQGARGQTNVWRTAQTFGAAPTANASYGESGWNYSNGDGVLFYPGTDTVYPAVSLGQDGPIASLRLKLWRRGIQDADYIAMARARDAAATDAIVARMVPKALWEVGVSDASDPTWVRADISWSTNPAAWEQARADLAAIIERP